MRKWFAAMMAVAVVASLSAPAMAADPVRVLVGDQELVSEVAPYIDEDLTMVPLRPLAEQLGFDITWVEAEQRVQLDKWPRHVELIPGSDKALVNGSEVQLQVPVSIVDGYTVVPVRFVSEQLGAQVGWDAATATVTVQPMPKEEEQAWELLAKSNQQQNVSMKATGTATTQISIRDLPEGTEAPEMPAITMNLAVQSEGENALVTIQTAVEGETFEIQTANVDGQIWMNMPGEGWTQLKLEEAGSVAGLPAGMSMDPTSMTKLGEQILAETHPVLAGEETVNGVQTQRVDIDLSQTRMMTDLMNQSLDTAAEAGGVAIQMNVDKYVLSMWLDEEGFPQKATMEMVMAMRASGEAAEPTIVTTATGEFLFQPTTESLVFPEELMALISAEPAEETPAEPAEAQAPVAPAEGN